jgi:hypothetical protein
LLRPHHGRRVHVRRGADIYGAADGLKLVTSGGATLQNYPTADFPSGIGAIGVDLGLNLLVGIGAVGLDARRRRVE